MMAYEFQAIVNDGVINIPAEYRNRIASRVKVILLSEEPIEKSNKIALPSLTIEDIDAILKGSIAESLIGVLPQSNITRSNHQLETKN